MPRWQGEGLVCDPYVRFHRRMTVSHDVSTSSIQTPAESLQPGDRVVLAERGRLHPRPVVGVLTRDDSVEEFASGLPDGDDPFVVSGPGGVLDWFLNTVCRPGLKVEDRAGEGAAYVHIEDWLALTDDEVLVITSSPSASPDPRDIEYVAHIVARTQPVDVETIDLTD